MTTTIKGRKYSVKPISKPGQHPTSEALSIKNGWDGISYMLTGARGAVKLALKNAKTGEFTICF